MQKCTAAAAPGCAGITFQKQSELPLCSRRSKCRRRREMDRRLTSMVATPRRRRRSAIIRAAVPFSKSTYPSTRVCCTTATTLIVEMDLVPGGPEAIPIHKLPIPAAPIFRTLCHISVFGGAAKPPLILLPFRHHVMPSCDKKCIQ